MIESYAQDLMAEIKTGRIVEHSTSYGDPYSGYSTCKHWYYYEKATFYTKEKRWESNYDEHPKIVVRAVTEAEIFEIVKLYYFDLK